MKTGIAVVVVVMTAAAMVVSAQSPSHIDALVALMRPLLPFPAASADGELPADHTGDSKWFVVWPASGDTRISVKANPLHPETQRAGAEAMDDINRAVAAAERKAQAAYDKAVEQLRRTGKGSDIDTITLDDEGIAGERIDAELEVTIELQPVTTFSVASAATPVVTAGAAPGAWVVTIPANTYRGADGREHYRAAETHLYYGLPAAPSVTQNRADPQFRVSAVPGPTAFVVTVEGNEGLVKQLVTTADWSKLAVK